MLCDRGMLNLVICSMVAEHCTLHHSTEFKRKLI